MELKAQITVTVQVTAENIPDFFTADRDGREFWWGLLGKNFDKTSILANKTLIEVLDLIDPSRKVLRIKVAREFQRA